MIVTLSSDNPNFTFLIGKNPHGFPVVRSLRNGSLIGWFPSTVDFTKYVIYFNDNPDNCSFQSNDGSTEGKYLNVGQYSSPLIVTGILTELLSSAIKNRDEIYNHEFFISGLSIKNIKLFQSFRDTFNNVKFEYKHLIGNNYEVILKYNGLLSDFMNIISLLAIMTAFGNKEHLVLDKGAIEKYIRQINTATTNKVPNDGWYLRYIFKKRAKLSSSYFHLLNTNRLKMSNGSSSDARIEFIMATINNFDTDFVDVGCGSETILKHKIQRKWVKQNIRRQYYLIDADSKICDKHLSTGNICYNSIDTFYQYNSDFNGTVIMTEVIEHNDENNAAQIIHTILRHSPDKIIITTPNYEFNQFFGSDGSFRHDDHQWEMTMKQFQLWLTDICRDYYYDISFVDIGDSIDNISITSGAIIVRR